MATDASNQGQAAPAGTPVSGTNAKATTPAPSDISVVVDSGSSPILISAFQPEWQAAANRTARKTKCSISNGGRRARNRQTFEIYGLYIAGFDSCAGIRHPHDTGGSDGLH